VKRAIAQLAAAEGRLLSIRDWPLDEPDREAKIAKFAQEHGFRLRFYRLGMCAIFDKWTSSRDT
jgi:hypothetical protein